MLKKIKVSVHDQSETSNDQEMVAIQNEISGNLQSGGPLISNVGGGNAEIHPDTEMYILATAKIHRAHKGENEVDVPESLAIVEYLAIGRAGVLKTKTFLVFRIEL